MISEITAASGVVAPPSHFEVQKQSAGTVDASRQLPPAGLRLHPIIPSPPARFFGFGLRSSASCGKTHPTSYHRPPPSPLPCPFRVTPLSVSCARASTILITWCLFPFCDASRGRARPILHSVNPSSHLPASAPSHQTPFSNPQLFTSFFSVTTCIVTLRKTYCAAPNTAVGPGITHLIAYFRPRALGFLLATLGTATFNASAASAGIYRRELVRSRRSRQFFAASDDPHPGSRSQIQIAIPRMRFRKW